MIHDRPLRRTRGEPSPLVEAVTKHPGDWTIKDQDWGGQTNNAEHEMWVPLDDEPCIRCGESHNDAIRAHELMHTKLSPEVYGPIKVVIGDKTVPVSAALVEVAEEYRINHSVTRVEKTTLADTGWCDPGIGGSVASVMDQGKFTEVIKLAVAGGPGADGKVVDHLADYDRSLRKLARDPKQSPAVKKQIAKKRKVTEALIEVIPAYSAAAARIMTRKTVTKTLPSWSQTEELAAFLEANLREFNNKLKAVMDDPPPDLADLDEMVEDYGKGRPGPDLSPDATVEKHGKKLVMGKSRTDKSVDAVRWGKPSKGVTEAAMPLSMAPWKLQKANRAVEEGTIPRYMHRWPSDKRVFHRTKRLPGGTLLIDDSGSMGLSPEELDDIIEAAPAATVAVYAGIDRADGGEIRVVARNGKKAKPEDLSIMEFGGNGIDGPALEWLGSQPYPRIWVTDGGVTDVTFGFSWQPVEAAKRLCLKHKITVVRSAEEAAERMKRRDFAR